MRPHSTTRRPLLALACAAFLLGAGGNVRVSAQTTDGGDAPPALGGYTLNANAAGYQVIYDSPGLLPISPIAEVSLPDAAATLSNGPTSSALASLAYPGPVVADLGSVIAQGGADLPIPGYPVRAQAFYPGGPTEDGNATAPGAQMHAVAGEFHAQGESVYSSSDLPGFYSYGSIDTVGDTAVVDGQAVSRARTVMSDVNLFYGLIKIDSIVTDIVASSNGTDAASDGETTVNGVTFLGLAAALDSDGLVLTEQPADPGAAPSPVDPVLGQLFENGNPATQVVGPAAAVLKTLNGIVTQVVGANGTLNDLLVAAGIQIHVLAPVETHDAGAATRTANGVIVELTYNGRTEPVLSQLLAAIPTEALPSDNLVPGVPLQTSPQAAVNLLKETHITTFSFAPGFVSAVAAPAYVPDASTPPGGAILPPTDVPAPALGGGDFSTPTPSLGVSPSGGDGAGSVPISPQFILGIGTALPAAAIMLLVMGGPLFAVGSRRLADNTLAEAAGTLCPLEHDVEGTT